MLMYIGIVFSFIFGVLLHYTYAWSGRNLLIAFLAPTNESLFEHLKMLLTPYLIWTLVEYAHYGQFMHAFIPAKVISLYLGMGLIVGLYLAYEGLRAGRWGPAGVAGPQRPGGHAGRLATARPSATASSRHKRPVIWPKILIFAISVVAAFIFGEFLMTLTFLDSATLEIFFDAILVLTLFAFAAFTIYPPNLKFFKSAN